MNGRIATPIKAPIPRREMAQMTRAVHGGGRKLDTGDLAPFSQEWIAKFESLPFVVNKMILMKSSLSANGAQYEEIAAIRF
jgi:hypothetical protein